MTNILFPIPIGIAMIICIVIMCYLFPDKEIDENFDYKKSGGE
jgi:hypothetical protein